MTRLRLVQGGGGFSAAGAGSGVHVPRELSTLLPDGVEVVEVVACRRMDVRGLAAFGALLVVILAFVSLLAPEIWREPWRRLAAPLGVYAAPWLLYLLRQVAGRGVAVVTTDGLGIATAYGRPTYLPFRAIRRVRKAALWGGLRLSTVHRQVWIPAGLVQKLRPAVGRARAHVIATLAGPVDDPTGFLSAPVEPGAAPPRRGGHVQ